MINNMDAGKTYAQKVYRNYGNPDVINRVPQNSINILDVGCGAGDNARILKEQGKYVVGLTVSSEEAVVAALYCSQVILADVEKEQLVFDRHFDVIIMSHICEHLVYPQLAIKKLSEWLAPEGKIIIAVPNMAFYKYRWKLLAGNWEFDDSGAFDRTHLHFYSFRSADALQINSGCRMVEKIAGQPALPLWFFRKLSPRIAKMLDEWGGRFFPNLFSQQVVLTFRRD